MQSMTIDSAAIRLMDTILGYDEPDLEQALKAIVANIGVSPRMPRSRRASSRPGFVLGGPPSLRPASPRRRSSSVAWRPGCRDGCGRGAD